MANEYGSYDEPGIITEEVSDNSFSNTTEAPTDVGVVGQANLSAAETPADPNKVYQITRVRTAEKLFGPRETSLLTTALIDLLNEGASPLYATAPESMDVVEEDHSDETTTSVTLDNESLSENTNDITVTLDGTVQNVTVVYENASNFSPNEGDVFLDPVNGELELFEAPSASLDVSYTYYDYVAALDAIQANPSAAEAIDFLHALSETDTVQGKVKSVVDTLSGEKNYCIALLAAGLEITPMDYEQMYDSSRIQVLYSTRFKDGSSALAAYAGKRADLGLDQTAVGARLETRKQLYTKLDKTARGNLINQNVVPLQNTASGPVIKDDPTAVMPDNSDEQNIDYGFKRMALDYVYAVAEENEKPFIGLLNRLPVRNALEEIISDQMESLQTSNIVEGYAVNVIEESATQARVELSVTAPSPLRFIINDVSIGN